MLGICRYWYINHKINNHIVPTTEIIKKGDFFQDNVVESEQIIQFEQTLVNVNHHPKKDDRINQILLKVNALKGILMNKNNEFSSEELRAVENEIDSIINLASKGKRKIKDVIQNGEPSNEGLEKEMQFSKKQKESKNITLHASQ